MKIGVVDVGGGMRGIYGAGVFDRCIDDKVTFTFRCYRDSEYEIGLLVQDGKGKFDNIVFQK